MRTVTCCIQYILPRLCHLVSWVKTSAKYIIALVLFLFLLLLQQNSFGQTATATWALTTNGNPVTTGNISATAISGGPGISGITFNTNWATATGWSNSGSIDANDYFELSISPLSGYNLILSGLSFDHIRSKDNGSGANNGGPLNAAVYYSTNEFSTSNQIGIDFSVNTNNTPFTASGLSLSVPDGSVLTFRIYGWNAENK